MKQILNISSSPRQKMTIATDDNIEVTISLAYRPTQRAWYFDIVSANFTIYGCKLVNSYNILRRYRNIITFGISCRSADGIDPFLVSDFDGGRSCLFLLNSQEIKTFESGIYQTVKDFNNDD